MGSDKRVVANLLNAGKYVLFLLMASIIGFFVVVMAYMLPTERIYGHVREDLQTLEREGDYTSAFGTDLEGTKQDNYSDACYLGQALVDGRESPVYYAMSGLRPRTSASPVGNLLAYYRNPEETEYTGMHFFWNGWVVVLKILLQVLSYSEIRLLNVLIHTILLVFLMRMLHRTGNGRLQIPFLLAILFMNPVTMGLTMAFAGYYYQILISCIIMLRYNETLMKKNLYGLFFALLGVVAFFFNVNYFQLCTVGFPLVLYFLINEEANTAKMIRKVLLYGGSWVFGFFGMMLTKWMIYAIAIDSSIFAEQLGHIMMRMGDSTEGGEAFSRITAITINARYVFFNKFLLFSEVFYLGYVVFRCKKVGFCQNHNYRTNLVFIFLSMLAVNSRYFLEANHSYVHDWVVYRNWAIVIFAFNAFLAKMLN